MVFLHRCDTRFSYNFRRRQRWPPRFTFLGNYTVFLYVLFITLIPQVIFGFITYSREELLDIRATSTHQHHDQEYDFPEADPLLSLPPRNMDLIPVGDPKQLWGRRGRRSGFLVRLRRRAHRAPLPSILIANVQSIDNKVDGIRARVAFQRDIRDWNVLCFTETWPTRDTLPGVFLAQTEKSISLVRSRAGVYAL